jgi:hypothetical protein
MGLFERWLRRRLEANENLVDRAILAVTEQEGEDQIQPDNEQQINAQTHLARRQALEDLERAERALRAMLPLTDQIALLEEQKELWRIEMPDDVEWNGEYEDITGVDPDRLNWMDRMYDSRQWRQVLATLPGWEPHDEGDYHINMDEVDMDDSDLAIAWSVWDRLFGADVRQLKREYMQQWQRIPPDIYLRFRHRIPDGNILREQRANGPDMIRDAISYISLKQWTAAQELREAYEQLQNDRINYVQHGCRVGQDRKRKFDDESRQGGGGGAGALAT